MSSPSASIKRKTCDETIDKDDQQQEISTSKLKKKRLMNNRANILIDDDSLDVSDYYVENGNRKVYPYYYTYHSYCKGRWLNKTLGELFADEFRALSTEKIAHRIDKGLLQVNNGKVPLDYKLKPNDFISHRIHRHEFPVLAAPIPIIHSDEELLVIDKPPSLPVHACGKFRFNSIISVFYYESIIQNKSIVLHRLDRLTSGIMIMAKTKAKAQKLHEEMRNREMHKEYLCRVEGEFPEEPIECDQPIETLDHRIGICIVSPNGKPSRTKFQRLNYNGKSSTVLALPLTGRMHQIRVHLQYLGHPIVNDSFYNCPSVFGKSKGKNGDYDGKTHEQLLKDLDCEHSKSIFILNNGHLLNDEQRKTREMDERNTYALKALEHYTTQSIWNELKANYAFNSDKYVKDPDCEECQSEPIDPVLHQQLIYLHALKYKGKDWSFETQRPVWSQDTWTFD